MSRASKKKRHGENTPIKVGNVHKTLPRSGR